MKQFLRAIFLATTCLVLVLVLPGCSILNSLSSLTGDFDATLYVRGTLDKLYLGEYDGAYLDIIDATSAEVEQDYHDGIDLEYSYMADRFQVEDDYITDETREQYKETLRDIYKHSKYEVDSAAKVGDEYSVKVTVHPITIFYDVMEQDLDAYKEDFAAQYEEVDWDAFDTLPESEQDLFLQEYEETWAQGILALIQARSGNISYADPVVELMRVYPEGDYYHLSDEDMSDIDWLILKY